MISCGSYTKIFGTALRKFGIPVKFIHGILEETKNLPKEWENRRAWLEFYNPQDKNWIPIDFTEGSLEPRPTAIKYTTVVLSNLECKYTRFAFQLLF
jgi:hypothetical protein